MPDDLKPSVSILPDGSRVVPPAGESKSASGLRVEIRGMLRCAYNNRAYDAAYECDSAGQADTTRPHHYLAWQPRAPVLEEEDIRAHRYIFRFPTIAQGVLPTVRVDVDRFVDDFLIPPSEVRASLSGQFDLTVWQPVTPPPSPWRFPLASVPALAVTGGIAWVLHRRMTVGALDFDLQSQLGRIRRKAGAARAAVRPEDARLVPVRARLTALEEGAGKLAKQAQQIRSARAQHDRAALESDAEALTKRGGRSEAANEEIRQTLLEKEKSLAALTELEKAESQCASRLARVEAILESALAGLQSVRVGAMPAPVGETVFGELDAEVSALREATDCMHQPPIPTVNATG